MTAAAAAFRSRQAQRSEARRQPECLTQQLQAALTAIVPGPAQESSATAAAQAKQANVRVTLSALKPDPEPPKP